MKRRKKMLLSGRFGESFTEEVTTLKSVRSGHAEMKERASQVDGGDWAMEADISEKQTKFA